jgi:hypothetical protein
MPHMREVKTCDRCRHFKRRCDLLKPSCTRCSQAGVRCSFEIKSIAPSTSSASLPGTTAASLSPSLNDGRSAADGSDDATRSLISPSASTDDAEPQRRTSSVATGPTPTTTRLSANSGEDGAAGGEAVAANTSAPGPASPSQKIIRKRKRNCLSCLRCHRLKVKCDKELPCGRCKTSGNGRECYYSYNKGPNGGKFPCPTVPAPSKMANGADITKSTQATWQVSHEPRGSSHWRDLMTSVRYPRMLLLDSSSKCCRLRLTTDLRNRLAS